MLLETGSAQVGGTVHVSSTDPASTAERLPPGEVARAGLILIGLAIGSYLLWRLAEVLLLVFLAVLLATAIEPLVNRLRRGPFSKGTGALTVYGAIVLLLSAVAYVTLPNAAAQLAAFVEGLPGRIETLRALAEGMRSGPVQDMVLGGLERASQAVRDPGAPADAQIFLVGSTAARGVLNILTVFILAFYWLIERNKIKRGLLRLVGPRAAREVNEVWLEVEHKWGGWVRGQLVLMLAVGVAAGLGYIVLGLPSPLLLAGWAAVAEIVPMVGPFLAFLPAVLVALTVSPGTALAVILYAVVIQQIEGNVLVPRVMSRAAGISALTVMLGILVGVELDGLAGGFLAVPVAAALQVILAHVTRAVGAAERSGS
jgi:predicted PurR-regulated permease PerM